LEGTPRVWDKNRPYAYKYVYIYIYINPICTP
jgi:hypothetical protein